MRFSLPGLCLIWCLGPIQLQAAPTLTVLASGNAANLDLDGEGDSFTHIVRIAGLSASTSNPLGLTLTISTGSLNKADELTPIPFQVTTVAEGAGPPMAQDFDGGAGVPYQFSTQSPSSIARDIYVKYTPRVFQDPGAYNSIVNITVADN